MAMRIIFTVGTILLAVTAALLLRRYSVNEASVIEARRRVAVERVKPA